MSSSAPEPACCVICAAPAPDGAANAYDVLKEL